jgi:hypothetical protein
VASLVGQQPSAAGASARTRPGPGPRPATATLPDQSAHDLRSIACVQASAAVDGAARARGKPRRTQRTPAVKVLPDRRSQGPRRADRRWDGRADTSRLDAGRPDTSRLDAGRPDTRRPDRPVPDGHPTGGHRTAGHPTAGRGTSLGGHPMVDKTAVDYGGQLGLPGRGDAYDRDTAQKSGRRRVGWSATGTAPQETTRRGLTTAATRPS